MRKIILLSALLFGFSTVSVQAQRIEKVKNRLASPATGENGRSARVEVNESGNARNIVRRGDATGVSATVNGFRIVIFFDNGSSARSEAERIRENFNRTYPDVLCDIRYENPYFKVLAGNCVTSEDAVILLGRIRSSFPEAYIMREEIALKNFITPKHLENTELTDTETGAVEPEGEI